MIGWLIYTKKDANENASYIAWFIKEARKQDVQLKLVFREELQIGIVGQENVLLINGVKMADPKFAIIRVIEPLLQHQFEMRYIPTFNNFKVASVCNHKSYTYSVMKQLGIPIQPTYFLLKSALPEVPPLPFPFVLKSAKGRGGKQVFLVKGLAEWQEGLKKITDNELVIQSTENIQLGKDVRVFVIGCDIIAAVLRDNAHDFRANFKLGGSAKLFSLTPYMCTIIRKITNHFEFGLVGIDFLLNKDGEFVFNEIEDVVGSRILSETTDINLLEKYIQFIKRKVESI